jgi:hypothetical protein
MSTRATGPVFAAEGDNPTASPSRVQKAKMMLHTAYEQVSTPFNYVKYVQRCSPKTCTSAKVATSVGLIGIVVIAAKVGIAAALLPFILFNSLFLVGIALALIAAILYCRRPIKITNTTPATLIAATVTKTAFALPIAIKTAAVAVKDAAVGFAIGIYDTVATAKKNIKAKRQK